MIEECGEHLFFVLINSIYGCQFFSLLMQLSFWFTLTHVTQLWKNFRNHTSFTTRAFCWPLKDDRESWTVFVDKVHLKMFLYFLSKFSWIQKHPLLQGLSSYTISKQSGYSYWNNFSFKVSYRTTVFT